MICPLDESQVCEDFWNGEPGCCEDCLIYLVLVGDCDDYA